jgi:hypothetical protein
MSMWQTEEAGLLVEQAACDRWHLEHVANNGNEPQCYDAIATEETDVEGVTVGDKIDAKACAVRVKSGSSTRRGRWWFSRSNHEKLLARDGLYGLGVYGTDSGNVLRLALIDASTIDGHLSWSGCGDRHPSDEQAQLRWPEVFTSGLQVDGEASLGGGGVDA